MKKAFVIISAVLLSMIILILPIGCSSQSQSQVISPNNVVSSSDAALPSFADIIANVEPAVVSVNTQTVIGRRFVQRTVEGAGSGWIYDASGIIVTNNHVIAGANTITVQLQDGRTFKPTAVKTDPTTDLAILKINAGNLPTLKIGDTSKLRVGDWVVATGNALGMGIGASDGIVSRLGVDVQVSSTETYSDLIETNAAINPGNSGGPLVNLAGEVVGITSLKISQSGVEGMGYAINIGDALPVIQRLSK